MTPERLTPFAGPSSSGSSARSSGVAAVAVAVFAGLTLWASRGRGERPGAAAAAGRSCRIRPARSLTRIARRAAGRRPTCGRRARWRSAAARCSRCATRPARPSSRADADPAWARAWARERAWVPAPGRPPRTGRRRRPPSSSPAGASAPPSLRFPRNALPPAERELRDALDQDDAPGRGDRGRRCAARRPARRARDHAAAAPADRRGAAARRGRACGAGQPRGAGRARRARCRRRPDGGGPRAGGRAAARADGRRRPRAAHARHDPRGALRGDARRRRRADATSTSPRSTRRCSASAG